MAGREFLRPSARAPARQRAFSRPPRRTSGCPSSPQRQGEGRPYVTMAPIPGKPRTASMRVVATLAKQSQAHADPTRYPDSRRFRADARAPIAPDFGRDRPFAKATHTRLRISFEPLKPGDRDVRP